MGNCKRIAGVKVIRPIHSATEPVNTNSYSFNDFTLHTYLLSTYKGRQNPGVLGGLSMALGASKMTPMCL